MQPQRSFLVITKWIEYNFMHWYHYGIYTNLKTEIT